MQQTALLCLGKVIKMPLVSSPRTSFSVSSFSQASELGAAKKSSSLVLSAKLSSQSSLINRWCYREQGSKPCQRSHSQQPAGAGTLPWSVLVLATFSCQGARLDVMVCNLRWLIINFPFPRSSTKCFSSLFEGDPMLFPTKRAIFAHFHEGWMKPWKQRVKPTLPGPFLLLVTVLW